MIHVLKTWPEVFRDVWDAKKTFEFRKDDRGFRVGDTLTLREWNPEIEAYTGYSLDVYVSYLLRGGQFGLPEGYVIMQISVASKNLPAEQL